MEYSYNTQRQILYLAVAMQYHLFNKYLFYLLLVSLDKDRKGKEKNRVLIHTNLYYHPSSHSRVAVHLSDFCVTVMEI